MGNLQPLHLRGGFTAVVTVSAAGVFTETKSTKNKIKTTVTSSYDNLDCIPMEVNNSNIGLGFV